MSIMGGGSKGGNKQLEKDRAADPRFVYHGNPQNMDPGFRTPTSTPLPEHLRTSLATSGTTPKPNKKNSLISSRMS